MDSNQSGQKEARKGDKRGNITALNFETPNWTFKHAHHMRQSANQLHRDVYQPVGCESETLDRRTRPRKAEVSNYSSKGLVRHWLNFDGHNKERIHEAK